MVIIGMARNITSNAAIAGERVAALDREAPPLSPALRTHFHGLVGASPGMRRLYQRIEAAGATIGNLLIVGESGAGKELVARAVHKCGT
jgi:DNA-binding NtrC family response regulator